ncbi:MULTISPECIES: transporter [unclassified Lentimonas]|uniref:transporter n=1 Tax=unclassified Lentimonas TaxID=2630993 RepID=UPI0013254440|nr:MULTISPECIES: transporter [unclassified Lentimonas]CAA6680205.1 Unannotated [Lentimonas sp. CC4]CAA6687041.1 Unannotated [Lentimonas sp. CC6]CAA7076185.1 Unannotated [Lentimonas sp. CC4]CAA7171166.1 Unannotated [Lentimonas sp. CC21]CAA7182747.1 Unannotated [Lentimonas sp. CC8]
MLKHIAKRLLLAFSLAGGLATSLCAQELTPRRWSHLPSDINVIGVGQVYTEGDIYFDPALNLEDVEMTIHTTAVRYVRTFSLLEKSARIELAQGYQDAEWEGKVDGVEAKAKRNGITDSSMRFAINLYGAPALKGKAFKDYRKSVYQSETIVGAGVVVTLPTGQYYNDKLLNISGNRTVIRPQLGVVHNRGKWTYEGTVAAWCYTKNDDFWNDNELEQDPFYAAQGHLIYTYKPGIWASASIGYGEGGESKVNGIRKHDRKRNLAWAFSAGYSFTPRFGVKAAYVGTETQTDKGFDSTSFALAASYVW